MAKNALKISEHCAEAYNLLAEESKDIEKKLEYYKEGVWAGERFLIMREPSIPYGQYWHDVLLRSYLRSLEGYADTLVKMKNYKQAIGTYEHIIELNKNDNQGVRHKLVFLLIAEAMYDKAGKLLILFRDEESLFMYWAQFLIGLLEKGMTSKTKKDFEKAIRYNPYLIKFLTGLEDAVYDLPTHYFPRSKNEVKVMMTFFDPCLDDNTVFIKVLLVSFTFIRDLARGHNVDDKKSQEDDRLMSATIENLEDLLRNPEKIAEYFQEKGGFSEKKKKIVK